MKSLITFFALAFPVFAWASPLPKPKPVIPVSEIEALPTILRAIDAQQEIVDAFINKIVVASSPAQSPDFSALENRKLGLLVRVLSTNGDHVYTECVTDVHADASRSADEKVQVVIHSITRECEFDLPTTSSKMLNPLAWTAAVLDRPEIQASLKGQIRLGILPSSAPMNGLEAKLWNVNLRIQGLLSNEQTFGSCVAQSASALANALPDGTVELQKFKVSTPVASETPLCPN